MIEKRDEIKKSSDSSSENSLKNNLFALNVFIENVAKNYDISVEEIFNLLKQKGDSDSILIPSFILRDKKLGVLEAVTKYLKEEHDLTYHKIAVMLNRDDRVIWVTYNKAVKKIPEKFEIKDPNKWIPVSVFADSNLGPLEAISKYLVEVEKLNFKEIGEHLNRDNKSIWACYNRAKDKLKDE